MNEASVETLHDLVLFDGYELAPEVEHVEKLSADRRRTLKQRQLVERGLHPLTGQRAFPQWGTCGDCVFRELFHHHNRTWPKCTRYEARVTHSAASDCRAWWPACHDYEPGDNKVSPDAARWSPLREEKS